VVIEYLDSKEVMPVIQSEEGFEFQLTGKIKKLTGKGKTTIGVVHGFGARSLDQFSQLQQALSESYTMVSLQPDKEIIPAGIAALIVPGFIDPPSDSMRYALDQFRLSGRGLLILAGNADPNLEAGFQVRPIDAAANHWLKDFGVAVEPGLVMDMRASRIGVNQQQGQFMFRTMVDYPFMPMITTMNAMHPVTAGIESAALPFVSPLSLLNGVNGTALLRSSMHAAIQPGPPFDVNPLHEISTRFAGIQLSQSNLAVTVSGAAKAAFDKAPEEATQEIAHLQSADDVRVMVVGTPALLDDTFMDAGNLLFILNTLDWLARDEGLISLRSRGITQRPLIEVSSTARGIWKGIWIFGLPILVLCIGLWRWRKLRNVGAET
ncbi:MAG: Gldg family protein, partial [Mariprofundaceae bacterium]